MFAPQRSEYAADLLQGLPVILTSHREFAFNFSPFQGDDDGLKPVIFYSYDQEIVKLICIRSIWMSSRYR